MSAIAGDDPLPPGVLTLLVVLALALGLGLALVFSTTRDARQSPRPAMPEGGTP